MDARLFENEQQAMSALEREEERERVREKMENVSLRVVSMRAEILSVRLSI